jgi:transposase-like protein
MAKRNKYTNEFRADAIKLMETLAVKEVHEKLGVPTNTLFFWKREANTEYCRDTNSDTKKDAPRKTRFDQQTIQQELDDLKSQIAMIERYIEELPKLKAKYDLLEQLLNV